VPPESREFAPGRRPGHLHRTDWMALLSGLLFIGIGVGFLTGEITDPVFVLPVLVAGLGLAGFVAIIVRALRDR
jgi:hypothetical protein